MLPRRVLGWVAACSLILLVACGDDDSMNSGDAGGAGTGGSNGKDASTGDGPADPSTAERVSIDRFSESAATLMVRTQDNGLPEENAPVDYDQAPFITTGLGPNGEVTEYYNFDVQPTTPAPIYVLFRDGEDMPVDGQLNIIDVVPGDGGYNDFWLVTKVTVESNYVANTHSSLAELNKAGYDMETTDMVVNCPVVPDGSTAAKRMADGETGLVEGWYRGKVVSYFVFTEAELTARARAVPVSPIHVTFNVNPDEEGGGPASGFVTETDSEKTHNVLATLPDDADYSPLWWVNVYDNADFDSVSDLTTAAAATELAAGVATVNCPVVSVE